MVVAGIDRERRFVAATRLGKPSGLAIDDAELVVSDRLLRIRFERELQVLLSALEIARTVLRDTEIDARRTQLGRRCGDLLEQRDTFVVPALLQVGHRDLVIGPHVATAASRPRSGRARITPAR
mgnify:CR=1 FL=1